MKLKVTNSTTVKPTAATPTAVLWISNLDAVMLENYHVPTVYVYRSTGATDFFDTEALKASLGRALVEYYPLAGRLNRDVHGRIEIDCNAEGVTFVEAECDGAVEDFRDFTPRPEINLVPIVDYSQGISTYPLLLVQVTRFRCGGVGLGVALDHFVVDGFAASNHFIRTWAEIARGVEITTKPFFDRRVLAARNPLRPQFPHDEYLLPPTLGNAAASEVIFSIFKLTCDQLNALKAKCQGSEGNNVKYTTFETLTGHVWRCVSKARGLPEEQVTRLYVPVNGRSKLRLPEGYIGNVVFKATTVALCGELKANPLDFAVRKVHEAIARMDEEYLRSAIDYLETHMSEVVRGPACYRCPNLGVVSWARFGFYHTDFGWGSPFTLGFDRLLMEGTCVVLPNNVDDGALLIALVLPKEQMHLFEKLYYQI